MQRTNPAEHPRWDTTDWRAVMMRLMRATMDRDDMGVFSRSLYVVKRGRYGVIQAHSMSDKRILLLLVELLENNGTSVTNCVAELVTELRRGMHGMPELVVVEHCEWRDVYDHVDLSFGRPVWTRIKLPQEETP